MHLRFVWNYKIITKEKHKSTIAAHCFHADGFESHDNFFPPLVQDLTTQNYESRDSQEGLLGVCTPLERVFGRLGMPSGFKAQGPSALQLLKKPVQITS